MVEETNQAIYTIKELLERMVLPQVQQTSVPRPAKEGTRVEQQVAKTATRGHATSNRHANFQQITRSQVESTQSAATGRRRRDEVGPSRPYNKIASGCTIRPGSTSRSQERGVKEDPI